MRLDKSLTDGPLGLLTGDHRDIRRELGSWVDPRRNEIIELDYYNISMKTGNRWNQVDQCQSNKKRSTFRVDD